MTGGFISRLTEKSKGWPESWPGLFLLQSFGKENHISGGNSSFKILTE